MAIQAIVNVTLCFVPDGANAMSVPSAQSLDLSLSPSGSTPGGTASTGANLTMPGGNTVTAGNLTTLATQIATALTAQFTTAANLATVGGWPTGGL